MESLRNKYIIRLCINVESYIGCHISTPKDFVFLREQIFHNTHQLISTTTLKRVWGYLRENTEPRKSTLDLLSNFIGFDCWSDFCLNSSSFNLELQEGIVNNNILKIEDLDIGQELKITWNPNSFVKLKYLGNFRFTVLFSRNTYIRQNDTCSIYYIIENKPLLMLNLRLSKKLYSVYYFGKVGGVRFDILT